jgi:hypothetical protein
MKVNWGYGWSNMMGQIGYPRPPLPTGVRVILTIFWVVVGLILALPLIFAALFAAGIFIYILQPNVSNPSDRPITSPPLVAIAEQDVPQSGEPLTLPRGADIDQACPRPGIRGVALGEGFALQVCDRSAKDFGDPPTRIYDIRILDRDGRFVKQFGSDGPNDDLAPIGTNRNGDLLVTRNAGLYRIPAADLR